MTRDSVTIETLADLREQAQDFDRMADIDATAWPMLAAWARIDMAANAAALGVRS